MGLGTRLLVPIFVTYIIILTVIIMLTELPVLLDSLKHLCLTSLSSYPPDVISLQRSTPKVVGVKFKVYTAYNLRLK
jgi:hypothetical protein